MVTTSDKNTKKASTVDIKKEGKKLFKGTDLNDPNLEQNDEMVHVISDVPVRVSVVLGQIVLPIKHLLKLGHGSVLDLNRPVGDPIDILVNERVVARGEVVVVDEHLGIKITEIIKTEHLVAPQA